MKAVILDLEGMQGFDLTPIESQVDQLEVYDFTRADQVAERISGYEIVITNKAPLSAETIHAATDLQLICVLATGANVIDLNAAQEKSIPVCNSVAYGVDSVVQHVFSLILTLHNNLLNYYQAVREGRWQRSQQFCFFDYPIIELKGKKLGIVGYGNLGKGVAEIARAFGMQVLVAARHDGAPDPERLPLDQLTREADIISLHCPLTAETKDLFDAERIAQMKKGSFLINAARGGVVNESALLDAVKSAHLAGAATDVLTVEPPKEGNILLDNPQPNLIVTPHIAWGSREARQRIIDQTVENIAAYKQGKPVRLVTP